MMGESEQAVEHKPDKSPSLKAGVAGLLVNAAFAITL
jgi:hypothetical protein